MSIKDTLLQRLSAAVKEVQCICTESIALTSDNPCVQKVCHCLDRILLDGLRAPSRGYWELVSELSHKDITREIRASRYLLTNHGRARAWLFRALSESLLESYLSSMAGDVAMLRRYYDIHALLADANRTALLLTVLAGLEHCDLSCVAWNTVTFLDVGCVDPVRHRRGDNESSSSGSLSAVQLQQQQQESAAESPHVLSQAAMTPPHSPPPQPPPPPHVIQIMPQPQLQLAPAKETSDFSNIPLPLDNREDNSDGEDESLVVERKLVLRQKPSGGSISYYRLALPDSEEDESSTAAATTATEAFSSASPHDSATPTVVAAANPTTPTVNAAAVHAVPHASESRQNVNETSNQPLLGEESSSSSPGCMNPDKGREIKKQWKPTENGLPDATKLPSSLPISMLVPEKSRSRYYMGLATGRRQMDDVDDGIVVARSLADELLEAEAALREAADAESESEDNSVTQETEVNEEKLENDNDVEEDDGEAYAGAVDPDDEPSPFDAAALSSDYALPLRQVQETLGDPTIAAAFRALWWRGDAWTACLLCLSAGRLALVSSGSLARLCQWRPESLDHVCQSGQGHLIHLSGVARSARHFVACADQSIGESAARALRRYLPTVPLFRGSPCQDVGLGKWLRSVGLSDAAPLHYALATHELLLDASVPVMAPRGQWMRCRLLLAGGWLLVPGGSQWSLAGCRGCQMVPTEESVDVVGAPSILEVTLSGGDRVLIGGPRALAWKQAVCGVMSRGGTSAAWVLTLLVTERGLALGAEVPGQWTVETFAQASLEEVHSLGYDPHYPTYLTLRLQSPTTWLICLGSAEERNRLGRLLRHLLPRLPLRRLAPGQTGGLRASARALTLLSEQTLP